jgi:hypothetical protein
MPEQTKSVRPQKGPQEAFLCSPADVVVFGGAAGGGKTWALLVEPIRHINNPEFGAVLFRRTSPEITNHGGLWDESRKLYPHLQAKPNLNDLSWTFPTGAKVRFSHLQHSSDVHSWQGAKVPLIGFDQLEHFEEFQFFYLLTRNRSLCGVRPYVRATCNPDADSWLAKFIAWWIDPNTGMPIPERAGVLRWFVRGEDEKIVWADTKEELEQHYRMPNGEPVPAKSVTFIPSKLADNPI